MKNLAIDTSSEVCGVSLLENDKLIDDNSLNNGKTHSENLMELIKEILERNNIGLNEIDLISCVVGPGSFTGIRIGISSVKAMAEVYNIKIASVTSLETLAQGLKSKIKVGMIDARNDQVYCGIFDENYNLLEDYIADSIDIAINKISKYEDIEICGNGAEKFKTLIKEKIPNVNLVFPDPKSPDKTTISVGLSLDANSFAISIVSFSEFEIYFIKNLHLFYI